MNDEHPNQDSASLSPPLDAAVRAVLAEELSDEAIQRVKTRARQLAETSSVSLPQTETPPGRGWRASRSFFAPWTVAAALLIVATAVVWLQNRPAGQAFADVIAKVKAANSVRLTMTTRFGHQPQQSGQMYLEANRLRLEQFGGLLIQVGDFDAKQALFLDMQGKLAQTMAIDAKVARGFVNPIEQLRHAKSNDAEQIGQEILGGRRTQVYRLRKVDLLGMQGTGEMMLWVDVESELPAKIVVRDPDPKAELEVRFEQFTWNEPLDAKLFALNIPAGFKQGVVVLTPPRSSEPVKPDAAAPVLVDGAVRDRVAASILWNPQGTTITALMRDPEKVSQLDHQPNQLRQWELATGKLQWSENVAGAGCVAGTADGKVLATVIGYEVQLRSAATGKITQKWTTEEPLSPLAFSPDGKTLAAGIAQWGRFGGNGGKVSGGVQFWNVEQASLVRSVADDKPVTFIKYTPDGKYLATSSNDGPVKMWDAATGELARVFPGHAGADFSPDGETMAFVSATASTLKNTGVVELCNRRDGSLVRSFTSQAGTSASYLLCVTFSPDGRRLAATDWNGSVTLWDVESGERLDANANQPAGVLTAVFSPDGGTLALGCEDKTLRLWKVPAELLPSRGGQKK